MRKNISSRHKNGLAIAFTMLLLAAILLVRTQAGRAASYTNASLKGPYACWLPLVGGLLQVNLDGVSGIAGHAILIAGNSNGGSGAESCVFKLDGSTYSVHADDSGTMTFKFSGSPAQDPDKDFNCGQTNGLSAFTSILVSGSGGEFYFTPGDPPAGGATEKNEGGILEGVCKRRTP